MEPGPMLRPPLAAARGNGDDSAGGDPEAVVTIPDPPADTLRQVLARHGWRCCVCGRPCRGGDVWRHSEPGLSGDGPDNFSAMCPACIAAWVGKGAAPARYVVRVSDPG